MSKSLKGTRTEKNILTAFTGESQARNRYTFFAKQARKDGYVQMADIFEETAEQEMVHAKTLFKLLEGGEVEITASFPAGRIGTTLENLREAAHGEHHEWECMYPKFARIAKEEGFPEIASIMLAIAVAEKQYWVRACRSPIVIVFLGSFPQVGKSQNITCLLELSSFVGYPYLYAINSYT